MGNVSEELRAEGRAEGRSEGRFSAITKALKSLMKKQKLSAEEAMDMLDVAKADRARLLKVL